MTFLMSGMSFTPVSANFFPFTSKKAIPPREYSEREAQINDYNEKAAELFEEGHFEQAQELWERAIEIMENSRAYFPEDSLYEDEYEPAQEPVVTSIKAGSAQSEIEKLYQKAVNLFKKQKYVASKHMFDRVEATVPDYKATRNYLTILGYKIKKVQQSLSDDKFKKSALERRAEREEWKHILEESEKELHKRLTEQVAPLYEEAARYYQSRNFRLAKDYFNEINGILPGYKDTVKYLTRIDKDIREEEERLLEEKNKSEILARKKEQAEWQRIMAESERRLQDSIKEQAVPLYEEAQHYYRQREFELAKSRFEDVEQILPDYKSVRKYLARIDQDMEEEAARVERERLRDEARRIKIVREEQEREKRRLARVRAAEEQEHIRRFEKEVARRRQEREEWLRVLKEKETERRRNLEAQAEFVYSDAVKYYKRQDLGLAKKNFLEVNNIIPGYQSTEKYLARIDHDIEEMERQRLAQTRRIYEHKLQEEQRIALEREEEKRHWRALEDKKRLLEYQVKARAREQQREEWSRILENNERERQRKLNLEADFIYKEAVRAYKNKDWERARDGFIDAQQIMPGHKQSEKYLAQIDKAIVKAGERRRAQATELNEQRWREEALVRKREEERRGKIREEDQRKLTQRRQEQAQAVYRFAESLYKRGDYAQAKDKFLEVDTIVPGYKSTSRYLARIDDDITEAKKLHREEQRLAFERQVREQQVAQLEEERRLDQMFEQEETQRLAQLRKKAALRQKEREEWEQTTKRIENEHQKRLQQQAELIYQEALRYYQAGWYQQAKTSFEEVEETVPGYKSTRKYIARADKNMKKERLLHHKSEQKVQEYGERESAFPSRGPADYSIPEPNGNIIISKAVEERQKARSKEAEVKYREALSSYKAKDFIEAKLKFIEVESFSPGYKSTLDYLNGIDEKIMAQKETLEYERRAPSVSPGRQAQDTDSSVDSRNDLVQRALWEQERVLVKPSPQRQSADYGRRNFTQDRRKELKTQRRLVQKKYEKQFRQLYDEAVRLYRAGSYTEARKLFMQIERMKPGYKRAASYLKKADARIQKGLQKEGNNNVAQSPKTKTRNDVVSEALDIFEQRL